jgi:hypothetical protein
MDLELTTKGLFGLTVVPAAIFGAAVLACLSKRIRDFYFVLLIVLLPRIEHLDVNFVSREWYRGTSRGFEVSLLDPLIIGLLVGSLVAPRRGEARAYWPASFGLVLFFFLYACFNVAIADPQLFGFFELWKWLRCVLLILAVALYLRGERQVRLLILALALLIYDQGFLAIRQRYMEGLHRVPGAFVSSNSLSVLLCLVTPMMVAAANSRIPTALKLLCAGAIPLACVAEVLTISRAGSIILPLMLLGATLATMSYRITTRKIVIGLLVVAGAAGITAKGWHSLTSRFEESSLKDEYGNTRNLGRGYYLRVARLIAVNEFFGVGLNNWSYWVSGKYSHMLGYGFVPYKGTDKMPSQIIPPHAIVDDEAQAAPAHNLSALTLGELGIPGLAIFLALWLRWFQMGASFFRPRVSDPMRRMAVGIFFSLGGGFLHAWTEWALRQYAMYFMVHVLAGALAGLCYLRRQERKMGIEDGTPLRQPGEVRPLRATLGGAALARGTRD